MSTSVSIALGAALIAGAVAFGFWYQSENSPFERCVDSESALEVSRGREPNYARGLAVRRCTERSFR